MALEFALELVFLLVEVACSGLTGADVSGACASEAVRGVLASEGVLRYNSLDAVIERISERTVIEVPGVVPATGSKVSVAPLLSKNSTVAVF